MLKNELLCITLFSPTIIGKEAFAVLNVGSFTLQSRKITKLHVQENILYQFIGEKSKVIHLDMKTDEGVDLVGNLYDPQFLQKIKKLQINTIFIYLAKESRLKLSEIFYNINPEGGYLLISNSHIFPAAPDPREEYYRDSAMEMYQNIFSKFKQIAAEDVEDFTHFNNLKPKSKFLLPTRLIDFFSSYCQNLKSQRLAVYTDSYIKNLHKNYSAASILLQKK